MKIKQRLAQVRADLSKINTALVKASKSRKIDQVISRGINIGALMAAEMIISEILKDMDEDEGDG